jgi:hypothetical protein
MVNTWAETGRMQVFPQRSDRLSGFDDASMMVLADDSDRLAAARGFVYGTLFGLMSWTLLIVALWR